MKSTEVNAQFVLKRKLSQVNFRHEIVAAIVFHHHFALTVGHRGAIVGGRSTAVEGNVMTVEQTGALEVAQIIFVRPSRL